MQYNDWQEIIAGPKKHPSAAKGFYEGYRL